MNKYDILKKYFGYDSFREGQETIIDGILEGKDVMAIMPTGAGKSLCYQVPAMLLPGVTLVISPLISLMQDQVKALNEAGIHAAFINSSLTEVQIDKALALAERGAFKIIYVAPERLTSYEFIRFAQETEISMVTVDESHCISQWGQDFRPSYLRIIEFVELLAKRPILSAFTATATREVKEDIQCSLKLRNPIVVTTGFDRENLCYYVEHTKQKDDYIFQYIEEHPTDSGIIYCATRKNVDQLFEALVKRGVSAGRYHAGMGNLDRKNSQDAFVYDRTQVIVATNAFGMGIDKSNVRYVIHYNMPQSMENYYQEAGRAGRDGEESQCILLFSPQDIIINRFLLDRKDFSEVAYEDELLIRERDLRRLHVMENYCNSTECLRNIILHYFGEERAQPCEHCGNCYREYKEADLTAAAKWVMNCVYETRGRYGSNIVIGTLLGAKRARLRELGTDEYKSFGRLSDFSEVELKRLVNHLIQEGYLVQTADRYPVVRLGQRVSELKDENTRIIVRYYEEKELSQGKQKGAGKRRTDVLTKEGYSMFEALRSLRTEIAREEGIPPYIVFNDKTLVDMCVKMPHTLAEFLNVSGVGENKKNKYGERFLEAIRDYEYLHPGAVFSIPMENSEDETAEKTAEKSNSEKKARSKKAEFHLTQEEAANFNYRDYYYVSEICQELNRIRNADQVKTLQVREISQWLLEQGYITEERSGKYLRKEATEAGYGLGIVAEENVSKTGEVYKNLKYPVDMQKMIVELFIQK